jgi:hypothetical protein
VERKFRQGLLDDDSESALEAILIQRPNPSDTHPPLRDRLAALGEEARLPAPIERSAAEHFVGKSLVDLRGALNRRWESQVTASWKAQYDQARALREKLDQLTEKSRVEKLSAQEMWQMAALTEAFHGVDAAVPLYQQILIKNENHAPANLAIGRILLSREDFNGIPMIEQAMDLSSDLVPAGCALIQVFFGSTIAKTRPRRSTEGRRSTALERRRIHRRDRFIETGLDDATIAPIREELSKYPEVARAFLVRKAVTYFPEKFLFVLGVVPRFTEAFRFRSRTSQGLAKRVASKINLPCLVIVLRARWATRRIRRVNRAQIYSRPR